jgi:hypothetical protein
MGTARAGEPPRRRAQLLAPADDQIEYGTSHISIIDGQGNAVSMTTTSAPTAMPVSTASKATEAGSAPSAPRTTSAPTRAAQLCN